MGNFLDAFVNVARALGKAVDAAVPFAQGDRTKVAAVTAFAAPIVSKLICSLKPELCPVVDSIGAMSGLAVPIFAAAGLVRKPE